MKFDPENHVVKLCAQGMSFEGEGKKDAAHKVFQQAWNAATNDFEKFIAAHYVARHQSSTADKLQWDLKALNLALNLKEEDLTASLPSLYLNVAKGYEDLKDYAAARTNYETALKSCKPLTEDGYSKMIKGGITDGIERLNKIESS